MTIGTRVHGPRIGPTSVIATNPNRSYTTSEAIRCAAMRIPFFYDQPIVPEKFVFPNRYIDIGHGEEIEISDPWRFLFNDPALSAFYLGSMLKNSKPIH